MLLTLFLIEILGELVATRFFKSKWLRIVSVALLVGLCEYIVYIALLDMPYFVYAVFVFCSLFKVINLFRFGYGRMNADYLKVTCFRSSWRLAVIQIIVTAASVLVAYSHKAQIVGLAMLAGLSLAMAIQAFRRVSRTNLSQIKSPMADKKLPVVSVLIPARNETEELTECLESVLASDYPKLEILVLDDCSHDKTPDIIKKFAHAGVRFVSGQEPHAGWLAKNESYDTLAREASGELLLFCGVDLRFETTAITSMVNLMNSQKLDMINVLPRRSRGMRYALFFQSARYLWELALPRQLVHRPPALSSCWIIKKDKLKDGFTPVAHSVMPERYFAWKAAGRNAYSFVAARNLPLVYSFKTLQEQRTTAVRMRYPQLRKRPEHVLVYCLFMLLEVFVPIYLIIMVLNGNVNFIFLAVAVLMIVLLNLSNVFITSVVSKQHALVAGLIFPFVALLDLGTVLVSMWRYEFGVVDWKGRNVCLPVMHVVSKEEFYSSASTLK